MLCRCMPDENRASDVDYGSRPRPMGTHSLTHSLTAAPDQRGP